MWLSKLLCQLSVLDNVGSNKIQDLVFQQVQNDPFLRFSVFNPSTCRFFLL